MTGPQGGYCPRLMALTFLAPGNAIGPRSHQHSLDPGRTIPFERISKSGPTYSILKLAMTKRKPGKFSATKAVKANARERVGQPKPARVVEDTPRTGRQAKHKPKLEQVILQEE